MYGHLPGSHALITNTGCWKGGAPLCSHPAPRRDSVKVPRSCESSLRSRVDKQNVLQKRLPAKAGPLASKGKGLAEQWVEADISIQKTRQVLPQLKMTSKGETDLPTAARSCLGVPPRFHPSDLTEKNRVGETPLNSKYSL